jgi:hypothetical protein
MWTWESTLTGFVRLEGLTVIFYFQSTKYFAEPTHPTVPTHSQTEQTYWWNQSVQIIMCVGTGVAVYECTVWPVLELFNDLIEITARISDTKFSTHHGAGLQQFTVWVRVVHDCMCGHSCYYLNLGIWERGFRAVNNCCERRRRKFYGSVLSILNLLVLEYSI